MNNLTTEQIDHFSGNRNHWCIVHYLNYTPFYYMGWFGETKDKVFKPAFTIDFNKAMKCHSRIAANEILNGLKSCSQTDCSEYKVEDHAWFGTEAEFEARRKGREGKEL